MVLSRFTFSSPSTVALIQQCHKFSSIIQFHIHISFNSPTYSTMWEIQLSYLVLHSHLFHKCNKFLSFIWFNSLISFNSPTYSKVQQSQWSYLVLHSHLIQQSHLFNSVTNSVVLSNFTFISHSTVARTYLTVSQI